MFVKIGKNVGNINTERPLEKTGLNYSEGTMLHRFSGPHFPHRPYLGEHYIRC